MDQSGISSPGAAALDTLLVNNSEKSKNTLPVQAKDKEAVNDSVSVGMKEVYKSLTVLADKVLAKLEEILKKDLPDGIASLKPEEHTPEATSQRIVDGTTALLAVYAKQHPELQGEELISSFMETIRGGIKTGYEDAMGILGSIGALDIGGVQAGIEETMKLVEEKLLAFEDQWRKDNGLTPKDGSTASQTPTSGANTTDGNTAAEPAETTSTNGTLVA